MSNVIAVKFVNWEVPQLNSLMNSKAYALRSKLNTGGKMNRDEKNWLTKNVNSNAYFKNAVPVMGWKFDFSDVLRRYLVRQYGNWNEYLAADATALRAMLYGRIDKIIAVK